MTNDTKNPGFCTIRRVENGWVMDVRGGADMGYRGPEHVFITCRQLATFIEDNFRLPRPTQEDAK